MTMQLIQTSTLGTAASTVEFTSIPQDGTDLLVLFSHRSSGSSDGLQLVLRFNGLTSGYSRILMYGDGSSAAAGNGSSEAFARFSFVQQSGTTSNTFGNAAIYIPNYTSSTAKSFSSDAVNETNATNINAQAIYGGLSSGTAAITSISLFEQNSVNFVADTTASLYKITKGSDGIVTTS
jgi:hypothetical protein